MTKPRPPYPPSDKADSSLPPKPPARPRPLPRVRLAYISPKHSRLSQIYQGPDVEDSIVRSMRKYGIPLTRKNYIGYNWGDTPKPWTFEHEDELPPGLQCWDKTQWPWPKRKNRR